MNRLRAWGLPAALALAAAAPAGRAADPAPPPADPKPWYGRVFGGAAPADKPKLQFARKGEPGYGPVPEPIYGTPDLPAARPEPRPVLSAAPLGPEALADALRSEQDAYLRRLDVCTKLRTVAAQTNDDRVLEQADALEQQATALYHGRVARLGVKGGPRGSVAAVAPLPAFAPPVAVGPADPAGVLDRKLGSGVAADPLTAAPPVDDGRPATAQARKFREVRP